MTQRARFGRSVPMLLAGAVALGVATSSWALALMVADFNSGQKPNLVGGDFGSWDKDPKDTTQGCTIAFYKLSAYGGTGYALRVDYDVDSPNPAYNGAWMKLENLDARPYTELAFYVKGDAQAGFTTQVKLELKNGKGEVGRFLLRGITDQWQQITIPLFSFEGVADWSQVTELVVVFDDVNATKKTGTIYLDEVTFQ